MKLLTLFLFAAFVQVQATGYSQQITIQAENMPLRDVFREIKKQSGYLFFYSDKDLRNAKSVTIKERNSELENVLQKVFVDQPLTYSIIGKTIVVKKKLKAASVGNWGSLTDDAVLIDSLINVSGRVVNSEMEPVVGATVSVKGTRIATSTDDNGNFVLRNVEQNAVIVVSGVNIQTREVSVGNRTSIGQVAVQTRVDAGEEVVVTGYYQLPRERITGAFSHLDEHQLEAITSMSLKDKLEGLVPGLLFEPGYNSDQSPSTDRSRGIVIRGQNTLGDNAPLIVVDGFPVLSSDGVDPWSTINPNDVKSITVLKDAAAASIWGAQAANGVIVISTKTPASKVSSSVSVNLEYLRKPTPDLFEIPFASSKDAIDIYKYMFFETPFYNTITSAFNRTRYDFPEVIETLIKMKANEITEEEGNKMLDELAKMDVRHEFTDLFLRPENYKKATVSFNNRSKDNNLRASVMALSNDKYAVGSSSGQVIANISNVFTPVNWFSFNFGLNLSFQNDKSNGVDIRDLQYIPQMSRILDENGEYLPMIKQNVDFYYSVPTKKRRGLVEQHDLPYDWDWNLKRDVDNLDITEKKRDLRINGGFTFKPLKWVTAALTYQYQDNNGLYSNYMNEETWYVRNAVLNNYRTATKTFPVPAGGMLYERRSDFTSHNGRFQVTANKTLGDHAIRALGGGEIRSDIRESIPYGYYGYDPQSLTHITTINYKDPVVGPPLSTGLGVSQPVPPIPTLRATSIAIRGRNDRYLSYYGNAGYTYKGMYDVTGSIRMDKTNLYGRSASYRELPQWSTGIGYTLSNASFFNVKQIDFLKFRVAYGWNGHINKNASPYITATPWVDPVNQTPYGAVLTTPNPSLTWEKTGNLNFGVDFAAFSNRLKGVVEIYKKKSTNVLADFEVNPTYGFYYDEATLNKGNIENKGVEIELSALITDGAVKWRSAFNYSHNRNRVVDIEAAATNMAARTGLSQFYPVPGQPIDYIAVAEWVGYSDEGLLKVMYDGKPEDILNIPYVGADLDALFKFAGQRSPKHFGSWINTINFKDFELSARFLYSFGHRFLNDAPPRSTLYYIQLPTSYFTFLPELMVDRWKSPDDNETAAMYGIGTRVANYNATLANDILAEYNTRNLLNAGHVRLQSVSLTYKIPSIIFGNVAKDARVMMQARNLGPIFLMNKEGVDPLFPKYSGSLYAAYYNTIRSRPDFSVTLSLTL